MELDSIQVQVGTDEPTAIAINGGSATTGVTTLTADFTPAELGLEAVLYPGTPTTAMDLDVAATDADSLTATWSGSVVLEP